MAVRLRGDDDKEILPFRGEVVVPPDKSISHRALMMAAMSDGTSNLSDLLDSQDVRSTTSCMSALGAGVDVIRRGGGSFDAQVSGWGEKGPRTPDVYLDCGNSGTTSRIMLGMLASQDVSAVLVGDNSLQSRPMRRVVKPLSMMGAEFSFPDGDEWDGGDITLPIEIHGSRSLRPIEYDSPNASAQVKTSILMAGLGVDGRTTVIEPHMSRNHTELMLPAFGVDVLSTVLPDGRHRASVTGPAHLAATDISVPGDPSSAMFLVVAAALTPGSELVIPNVGLNPTRLAGIEVAKRMGCSIDVSSSQRIGREPVGTLTVRYSPDLVCTTVNPDEIPGLIDEIPILSLLATAAHGKTVFRGVSELRVKESNRLAAIVNGLGELGCEAYELNDDLVIAGRTPGKSTVLDSKGDHRLAMTWVLANRCFGLAGNVLGLECIDVSYPDFLKELDRLQLAN